MEGGAGAKEEKHEMNDPTKILVERDLNTPIQGGIPVDYLAEIQRQANTYDKSNDICAITSKNEIAQLDWYTKEQLRDSELLTTDSMASVEKLMEPGDRIIVLLFRPKHTDVISAFRAQGFRATPCVC